MSAVDDINSYLSDPRANTIEGWIAAFNIFAKYDPKGIQAQFGTGADHDILYLPNAPAPKSVNDIKNEDGEDDEEIDWGNAVADAAELDALGFHYNTEFECWAKFV